MENTENLNDQVPSPQVTDIIDIIIKTIDANNFPFQVEQDLSIKSFKERIAPTVGIEPELQRLIYCGRVLVDDKTFKDYKIDSGKVIHLVKRLSSSRTDTQSNSAPTHNESTPRPSLFQSIQPDDSFLTFSLEPSPNLIGQIMRQIFNSTTANINNNNTTATNANATNQENSPATITEVHNRFNQVRRLMGYIHTCFEILENPNNVLPQHISFPNEPPTVAQYISAFNDTIANVNRLRTHTDRYFQNVQNPNDNSAAPANNHSIFMRITHHISHVFHLLTDFNIDAANNSLTLNVLPPNNNPPFSRVEFTSNTNTTTSTSANRNWTMPRVIPTQNPIVLMEVDATINGTRNLFTSRPNLSELNFSINNISSNYLPRNLSTGTTTPVNITTTNVSASSGDAAQPVNSTGSQDATNDTQSSATTTTTTSSATESTANINSSSAPNSTSTTTSSDASPTQTNPSGTANIPNPMSVFSQSFDPYLSCNSTYTIPELRSPHLEAVDVIRSSFNVFPGVNQQTNVRNSTTTSINSNNISSTLNNLFQSIQNSMGSVEQSPEFDEFSNVMQQILSNLNVFESQVNNGGEFTSNSFPRLIDILNPSTLNDSSFISQLMTTVFQNLNIEDLFNVIHSNFIGFNRFRQPLQDFIRTNLLTCEEVTIENIREEIKKSVEANRDTILNIIQNIPPLSPTIDLNQSFMNFIVEVLTNFTHMILQPTQDEGFDTVLISALKYLITRFIHFCLASFADVTQAIKQVISNFFDQNAEYLNDSIRNYMINIIMKRITVFIREIENDGAISSEVAAFIIHKTTTQPDPEDMQLDQDGQSISNDSEVEFSDAVCDIPSTSGSQRVNNTKIEPDGDEEWQSVVPNDWVPIIKEDIKKQKNPENSHQPPFSDAYISGMPKKRRLEHQQQQKQQPQNDGNAN